MNRIDVDAVNALRVLAADEVQKANSGHPGLPPVSYTHLTLPTTPYV